MIEYISYSYIIGIPALLIFISISLFLGSKLDSQDIILYFTFMLSSPLLLVVILSVMLQLLLLFTLFPISKLLKKLSLEIPKISNYELQSKKQLRAELILANYKPEQLKNGIILYQKDGVYILLDNMSFSVTYKHNMESFLWFSSTKMNNAIIQALLKYKTESI